jgi:histidinol-phosphate aminotransferase
LDEAVRTIERVRPGLVFLCNPNNPTGVYLSREFVLQAARAAGDGVLLLDEAYLPFVGEQWDSLPLLEQGNVLLLRSMTKDHALTGLRLGYAIGPEPLIERLGARQLSWSVNSLAQAAGVEALRHPEHALRGRQVVEEGRRYMISELRAIGLEITPSAANFVTVRVGDAAAVRRSLLGMGLCVRDCASFGMPEWIRIAVRSSDDCQRLMAALKKVLAHG